MYAVIGGGGDMGREVLKAFLEARWDITLIDISEEVCKEISERFGINTIVGDVTDPSVLSKAEIERADVYIAATGDENANVVSSLLAKEHGAKKVFARLKSEKLSRYLREKGILYFIPELAGVKKIFEMIYSIEDLLKIDGLKIFKYKVSENDKIVGSKVFKLPGMFSKYIVFAVKGEEIEILDEDMVVDPGDVLYICTKEDPEKIIKMLRS